MREHKRRWIVETKLSLIREIGIQGSVIETRGEFGADPKEV
jgi:hypothetical protein